jgi:pyroglutamyl-peptidase
LPSKVILLTGFEPFGGEKVNPSILACRRLDGKKYNGYAVKVEEVPLRFAEIKGTIEGHIKRHKPSAVISTGQGGGSWLNLERVAINVADATRVAYNCGTKPRDAALAEGGPAAYFTGLPIRRLLDKVRAGGVPAEISNSAGAFGCNQIFYHLMDYAARENLGIPAGFIHVPKLPEQVLDTREPHMSLDLIAKGLEIVVEDTAWAL